MASLIHDAHIVISRSGYTTLMDLVSLHKKAIFIPTLGQPEQLYLAKKLKEEGLYYSEDQKYFRLEEAIKASDKYAGIETHNDYRLLKERLRILLTGI